MFALRVLCLGPQRRGRLEAHEQQDGDRRLVQHVYDAVRDDHMKGIGSLEAACGMAMGDAEPDEQDADQQETGDLDRVDRDRGHCRPADAPEGDVPDQGSEDHGHDGERQVRQLVGWKMAEYR